MPRSLEAIDHEDLEREVDEEEGHEREAERSRTHGRGVLEDQEQGDQHHEPDEEASGELPSVPPCEFYCHTLTDPTILAPPLRAAGVQTLTVFVLHMPTRLFVADRDSARDAALAATLRSIDSVLAEPIEDCLLRTPDGAPCVVVRSPLDLEDELRMPGGNIFHRDLQWPFAEHEDEVGTWGAQTADPRVLLCGAGARRGGGVSAIAGHNAAMAILGRAA